MTQGKPYRRGKVPKRRVRFESRIALMLVSATVMSVLAAAAQSDLKLAYDKPAAKVLTEGGSVRSAGERLEISEADSVTILFCNATSFRNYRDIGGDAVSAARGYVLRASKQSYDRLRQKHVDDFRSWFSRVQLRLGEDHSTETTDRRIMTWRRDLKDFAPRLFQQDGQ